MKRRRTTHNSDPVPVSLPGVPPPNEVYLWGPLRVLITPEEDHQQEGRWRHVSVSTNSGRLPTYEELDQVRERYFDPDATVLQVFPPKSAWVNAHDACLHLWQRRDADLLPRGLYGSVAAIGSIPLDEVEQHMVQFGDPVTAAVRNLLRARGELSERELREALPPVMTPDEILEALWSLEVVGTAEYDDERDVWRWRPL